MNNKKASYKRNNIKKVAFLGLLLSLSLVLSFIEMTIGSLFALPPGVKLGLANIVTMFCLFCLGSSSAFTLTFLKSFFVFLMRGFTAFCMSLSGGIFSLLIMLLLISLKKLEISYIIISIIGGIFHNIGQLFMASLLLGSTLAFAYAPVLMFAGVFMGALTGLLFKVLMPYLRRIYNQLN